MVVANGEIDNGTPPPVPETTSTEDSSGGFSWDELEASIESASNEEAEQAAADSETDDSTDTPEDPADGETPPVDRAAGTPVVEGGEGAEGETVEPSIDPLAELRAQNLALKQQLDNLSAQLKNPPAAPAPAAAVEAEDYLNGLDFDEAVSSPEVFNKVLQAVATKTREAVIRELSPQLAAAQTVQTDMVRSAVDRFYDQHKDLAPFKTAVTALANEVYKGNPEWAPEKILTETAARARTALGLKAPVATPPTPAKKVPSPALSSTTRSSRSQAKNSPQMSDVEKEIMDLM